ncbi:hypothetical protein R6Q59_011463 [Mikania micrantha]
MYFGFKEAIQIPNRRVSNAGDIGTRPSIYGWYLQIVKGAIRKDNYEHQDIETNPELMAFGRKLKHVSVGYGDYEPQLLIGIKRDHHVELVVAAATIVATSPVIVSNDIVFTAPPDVTRDQLEVPADKASLIVYLLKNECVVCSEDISGSNNYRSTINIRSAIEMIKSQSGILLGVEVVMRAADPMNHVHRAAGLKA